jgi:hypothetical protein
MQFDRLALIPRNLDAGNCGEPREEQIFNNLIGCFTGCSQNFILSIISKG